MIRIFFQRLASLFFPPLCLCCNRGLSPDNQAYICFDCLAELPYTDFHELPENQIHDRLMGRIPLVYGGAYFYYQPNSKAQQLIHALKYYQRPEIGEEMGQHYGSQLKVVNQLCDLDYIIPVPLHPKRQHERGYNQAEKIAVGLANVLEVDVLNQGLRRQSFEASQTKKGRDERIKNVANTFTIGQYDLSGRHILLVDDVLTTGATLESCSDAILAAYPDARISLVVLGFVA
ncbi:MAG: ComF family protein [Bacteroidota bacterium]